LKITSSQRCLRWAALLLLMALPSGASYARTSSSRSRASSHNSHHGEAWARDHFAAAERMREALNGRPPADRTRRDYQRVINAYRSVYFGAPTSTKADPSVVAVAETLVEMGRRFDDGKILNEAIAQYKFLRKEYPGSKYRCDALFTIGEIYSDDLNDPDQARATFNEFLHRYPHNRLADDAQQAIAQLDHDAAVEKKAQAEKKVGDPAKIETGKTETAKTKSVTAKAAAGKDATAKDKDKDKDANAQPDDTTAIAEDSGLTAKNQPARVARVTGIRHWSTPDYTRVAIDLESEIKFGSQRIASPDRIFFDLRGTKLASTLVGKSFDVDDGFLKKIRVAQFAPGRTRVVLEVDNLSDYDAFLLPNPYRLIIDIHGKGDNVTRKNSAKELVTTTGDIEAAPKGSKPEISNSDVPKDVPKTDVTKNLPKSELKADMKVLAGEPVSKKEQLHDQPSAGKDAAKDQDKDEAASAKAQDKTREVAVKTPTGTIKKVIVEPDDNEGTASSEANATETNSPENTKSDTTKVATHPPGSRKSSNSKNRSATSQASTAADSGDSRTDDNAGNEDAANDLPVTSHQSGKSNRNAGHHSAQASAEVDAREARPTASGDRSLIRALGLKIGKIVIDPGHGGHDTGTIGPNGLEEKDLVLEVGRRLGKLLETRLGAEVVYTRKDDTFIPLETRTAIANQQRADLFISIHANSSHDADARGVETYYLNFTSSPEALEVAARENAVSEKSIYELQDLVKKIALKEKIEESREFAGDVQSSLHSGLASKAPAIRDRGVKKAPFIVLIGANMPSILAEISFVSNPTDERHLETSDYRQRIAESLYRGIAKYVDGLSGVKVASNKDKAAGQ
jgi:N-acetylmuramoyl-L-alanine amidase